jgi:uncharacterized membrane protein YjdF
MNLLLVVPLAGIDDVNSAGWLTLVFPLVLVFVIAAIWWVLLRHSRDL